MGLSCSKYDVVENGPVCLKSFNILRYIGKGAFGKVCIIQLKTTKQLFALKYMHKKSIVNRSASRNVLKELEILKLLHFKYLVNLCYSFQDDKFMYIVLDLMLGGDVRYHINRGHQFKESEITVYVMEMTLALDYLKSKHILHRDIKPDNLLLDSNGHIHLTDFNVATWLPEGKLAATCSGTKPYMAPEVFKTEAGIIPGYAYEVDWWSWGVCLYEMLCSERPFAIHHDLSVKDILRNLENTSSIKMPKSLSTSMAQLLLDLLNVNPKERLSNLQNVMGYHAVQHINIDDVKMKQTCPQFIPSSETFNCEPIHQLEEMIGEANPLKKQKRKKKTKGLPYTGDDPTARSLDDLSRRFTSFTRDTKEPAIAEEMSSETREILDGVSHNKSLS